ncbi:hypothetical protein M433DRAFT_149096 [Acidomyces richmondensis BFW]|nr:MAG: hypothetical protein FE78DRAFT_91451 [Acidomyces sp. 'richmondensis']KYG50206.1 hypothetical protein M433DRAFT_149096 [Acidomyces richmondensis BFW]
MVIKSDGTKWACQSCLKGHRVSGCTHTDRELTLVPKKGRPVTQCQHCRLERKKRSAHVSCNCGEVDKAHHSKEKCIHLREAEERAKAGFLADRPAENLEKSAAHLVAVGEEQGCCCIHGGKCTCAMLKKENDRDADGSTPPHGPAVKPRLEATRSDGHITVFQNGHHKPVHRKNHAAHECGMPYKMPMPRTQTDQNIRAIARRSVDSLALDSSAQFDPSAFVPQTSASFNMGRRMSKSEQPSPKLTGADRNSSTVGGNKFLHIDFSNFEPLQLETGNLASSIEAYTAMQPEQVTSAIADNTFDPWSANFSAEYPGIPNNNPFGVWPSNTDTSGMAQPALTAASSGTQSEIDEIPPMDDFYGFGMPSIQEDTGTFNILSTFDSNSPSSNRRSLPADFKPFDVMNANLNGDWQSTYTDFNSETFDQLKDTNDNQTSDFDNTWQIGSVSTVKELTGLPISGIPLTSRPMSRSVGQNGNDEIMRQLFPDLEVDDNIAGLSSNRGLSSAGDKDASTTARSSVPMDFSDIGENGQFTSQHWTDGSMSIPNDDAFPPDFELNNSDFSNPDFAGNWTR